MPSPRDLVDTFAARPDPGRAGTLDELVERLRLLQVWAGDPSYQDITRRVNAVWTVAGRPASELAGKTTVVDCFRCGRRRLNTDLVLAIVQALHPDVGYLAQWRQALRVIGGASRAAAQVRVQDTLPQDLAQFTGRTAELDRIHQLLHHSERAGDAVVISAIEGMAGVGKTQLAIHAGHLLTQENRVERVLFVNLRGFHPDPTQPPAEPAAVLDGFLRLLGVPDRQIPHELEALTTAYRERLAGTRTLVILDNAASEDQVRPMLPEAPGCLTLVTSRRSLTDLHPATHLTVDVFTEDEAADFLDRTTAGIPLGPDPNAPLRIAHRCGYLPLALGLVTGHIRNTPSWTLTDHADRLDERYHQQQRLDSGVELALDVSYRHLPTDQRGLLRRLASHPGQDLDSYAAAALADTDLATTQDLLDQLCRDHLLQKRTPGRYTFHDLVRAYATARARDEDPPTARRAALTRLFDYYLAAAAAAMDTLHPGEAGRRPCVPSAATPVPALTDPAAAVTWLDSERLTFVAVAAYTADHGWPTHTTRLSATLYRYLMGGQFADAQAIHGHAHRAAEHTNDVAGQANASLGLGTTQTRLGHYGPATEHFRQALQLYRRAGDRVGQARSLGNLGNIEERLGRYQSAADYIQQALSLYRQAGDRTGEAATLGNLGAVEDRLGAYQQAADHYRQGLILSRRAGDRTGEANLLTCLGEVEVRLGLHGSAAEHHGQALALFRQLGNRVGEAWSLDNLGTLHTHLNRPAQAAEFHEQSLRIARETGYRVGEAWALNGLGEAANIAGRPADALVHHGAAQVIAADIGARDQQARAHDGLGRAHQARRDPTHAHHHYQRALALYTELGMPQADQVQACLATLNVNAVGHPRAEAIQVKLDGRTG